MLENKPQIPPNYESPAQKVKPKWEEAEIAKEPAQQRAFVRWKILGVIFYTLGFLFFFYHISYPFFLPPPQYHELKTVEGISEIIKSRKSSKRISVKDIYGFEKKDFEFHLGCNMLIKYEFNYKHVLLKIDKFNYIYECHVEGKLLTSYQESINAREERKYIIHSFTALIFLLCLFLCVYTIKSKK